MEKHLALYRKYRPTTFEEVIGQKNIVQSLTNQIKSGNISHAYLFTGSRGTGKTSCAKIFARAINCKNPINGSPCGECEACKKIEGNNVDILEIDAASNNSVDDIREMIQNIRFMPVNSKYKVYIIDEVHMLSIQAFNALLKSIEEPPEHIVFIFATTEIHKVPATILSRVMRYDFRLVPNIEMEALLAKIYKENGIQCDEDSLKSIVALGEGSVRDMLSIADSVAAYSYNNIKYGDVAKCLGQTEPQTIFSLGEAIISKDISSIFEISNNIYLSGKNISVMIKEMAVFFRDLLMIKNCKDAEGILNYPKEIYKKYKEMGENAQNEFLMKCLDNFTKIQPELRYSTNPKILLEITSLKSIGDYENIEKKANVSKEIFANNGNQKVVNKTNTDSCAENEVEQKEIQTNPNESVKEMWGRVITTLREKEYIVLHALCGEIVDVEKKDDSLVLKTRNSSIYKSISLQSNQELLLKVLQDENICNKINIQLIEIPESDYDHDKRVLEEFFGEIKQGK